jgi:hypothetical protein
MSGKVESLLITSDGETNLRQALSMIATFSTLRVEWWYEQVLPDGSSEFTVSANEIRQLEGRPGGRLPFVLKDPASLAAVLYTRLETSGRPSRGGGDGTYVPGWTMKYNGYGPITVTSDWSYYGK